MAADVTAYQFVDTNILVYAHDASAGGKHEVSKALVRELWASRKGCLSIQVLQELYVTIAQKMARPLDRDAAKGIVTDLSFWRVHTPEVGDVLAAIEIQQRFGTSFWDAMILQSAIRLGCGMVWSEDLNPGQLHDGLRVMNPFCNESFGGSG